MATRSRGRFYEDGPYVFCDEADRHPQPCTCAAPQINMAAMPPLPSLPQDAYFSETVQEGDHP